jgi:hypothetical protein
MKKTVMLDMCDTVRRDYFTSFIVDVSEDMPDDKLETLVRAYFASGKAGFQWDRSSFDDEELGDEEIYACDIEDADDDDVPDVTQAEMESAIGGAT